MKSFKNLRQGLNESRDIGSEETPPAMMVLRRRGVRLFPDGQKIALYTNDRYGLMFSVPYGSSYLNTRSGSPLVAMKMEETNQLDEYVNVTGDLGTALVTGIKSRIRKHFGLDKEKEPRNVNVRTRPRKRVQPTP